MKGGSLEGAVALAIGGLLLASGCDAAVNKFVASPHYVCTGVPVQLEWKVTGSATMKSTPPLRDLPDGPVAAEGKATVTPRAATSVEIDVTRFLGNPTSSIQQIRMMAPHAPETLSVSIADRSTTCTDGRLSSTVHARNFASQVTVATVAVRPGDDRTYEVQHAGVDKTVAPGALDTAWAATPILGDWVLTTVLRPGEACGAPSLPSTLGVLVTTQCVSGEHP